MVNEQRLSLFPCRGVHREGLICLHYCLKLIHGTLFPGKALVLKATQCNLTKYIIQFIETDLTLAILHQTIRIIPYSDISQ